MDRETEILAELEQQIRANAFKAETFMYPVKDKQGVPYMLHALTHINILDTGHRKRSLPLEYRAKLNKIERKEGNIINLSEKQLCKIENQNKLCEKFIRRVASAVYLCRHAEKEILEQIERSTIDGTRRFLNQQIYGKRAVNAAMKILERDFKAQIRKNINYFYPPPSNKQKSGDDIKEHEDEALHEIYHLYEKYFPNLKPSNKRANMAFITAATDFWKDDLEFIKRVKLYSERLRNRHEILEEADIPVKPTLSNLK